MKSPFPYFGGKSRIAAEASLPRQHRAGRCAAGLPAPIPWKGDVRLVTRYQRRGVFSSRLPATWNPAVRPCGCTPGFFELRD